MDCCGQGHKQGVMTKFEVQKPMSLGIILNFFDHTNHEANILWKYKRYVL